MAQDRNTSGAPTEGLGQTVTFGMKLRQPGKAQGMEYVPAAPADVTPPARSETYSAITPEVEQSPAVTMLVKAAANMAKGAYEQAQVDLRAKGMQDAAAGKAIEDIERERPLMARIFGEGDAAEGARVYGAQNAATQALTVLDRDLEADAALDLDDARRKYMTAGQAIKTGDDRTDAMARDLFLKGLPKRFERHADMRVKYMQAKARSAEITAMTTAVDSLSSSLKFAAANSGVDFPESEQQRVVAGVVEAAGILRPPPGQSQEVHSGIVADVLKGAVARRDLHAVHALMNNGVRRYLSPKQVEDLDGDIKRVEANLADEYEQKRRHEMAALVSFDPRDGVSTAQRLEWLNEMDRDFRRATGSSRPLVSPEFYRALAKSSESGIREAREQDARDRIANEERRLRAQERAEARAERAEAKSERARLKAKEARDEAATLAAIQNNPGMARTVRQASSARGVSVTEAQEREALASRVSELKTAGDAKALDRYLIDAYNGIGQYVDDREAHTLRRGVSGMRTDPEYGRNRDNINNIRDQVQKYNDLVNRWGAAQTASYYGPEANFMRHLSQAVGSGTYELQAVADARRGFEMDQSPEGKRKLAEDAKKALMRGRGHTGTFGLVDKYPAMNENVASVAAAWIARQPGADGAEDLTEFAHTTLRKQDLSNTSTRRLEVLGDYAFDLPPGVKSVGAWMKDNGVVVDRTAEFIDDLVEKTIEGAFTVPGSVPFTSKAVSRRRVEYVADQNGAPVLSVSAWIEDYGWVSREVYMSDIPKLAEEEAKRNIESSKKERAPLEFGQINAGI